MTQEEKSEIRKDISIIVSVAAAFLVGYINGARKAHDRPEPEPIRIDTIWRVDTVKVPQPVPVTKWLKDTTYIPVTDTVLVQRNDTTYLPVPIETTRYGGDGYDYEAWVSGFQATLDSINIFRPTAVVEKQVPVYISKKWGIGLQAGVTWNKDTKFTPYVGVGLSYNLLSF